MTAHRRRLLTRVALFVTLTAILMGSLGMVAGEFKIMPANSYSAVFDDVSGLEDRDDVRAAGVSIGQVSSIEPYRNTQALVTFTVDESIPLPTGTGAAVKWKNLVGDRVLTLTPGKAPGRSMEPGSTIPASRTEPALDLDQLSNGFRPLFRGLNPAQINQLSGEILRVLQGPSGNFDQMFGFLATFTNHLADRDAVIGRVVDNLTTVLGTLDRRRDHFGKLIGQSQRLVSGLNADRASVIDSLDEITKAAGSVSSLLAEVRPDLKSDLTQVGRLAQVLNRNERQLVSDLKRASSRLGMKRVPRIGGSMSALEVYLCGVQVLTSAPNGRTVATPWVNSGQERCQWSEDVVQGKDDPNYWRGPDGKYYGE